MRCVGVRFQIRNFMPMRETRVFITSVFISTSLTRSHFLFISGYQNRTTLGLRSRQGEPSVLDFVVDFYFHFHARRRPSSRALPFYMTFHRRQGRTNSHRNFTSRKYCQPIISAYDIARFILATAILDYDQSLLSHRTISTKFYSFFVSVYKI